MNTNRFRNLEFGDAAARKQGLSSVRIRDGASWLGEAEAAFESGRFAEALRCYAKVLEFDPIHTKAWAGQVRMLLELGEIREAKLWADKALEVCVQDAELLAVKAVSLARTGDLGAALTFSDAAVAEDGQLPYVWLSRADVLLTRREKASEYCVEKALGLASFHWVQLWLASRVYAWHRQFARALQLIQKALETSADRAVVWLQAGECRWALGMVAAAQMAFEQASQLDPSCVSAEKWNQVRGAHPGGRVRGWWRRLLGK